MRRLIALIGLFALAFDGASPAHAHAALLEAHPADGSVLPEPPASVRLRFNEPVTVLVVRLLGEAGDAGPLTTRSAAETVEVGLPLGLGRGGYALSYRVISSDGHPVGGSTTFAVGRASSVIGAGTEHNASVAGLLWLSRLVMHAGLFVGVGGAFFLAWFTPRARLPAARSAARLAILAGLLASALAVGCQGLDALGAPLGSVGTTSVWATGFGTAFGTTACLAGVALCAAYGSLAMRSGRRVLAVIALVAVGAALAASGHAAAAGPPWITRTAVFAHGVAVAYWIGALVPLFVLLRLDETPLRPIVRAWSGGAVIAVAALALSGVVLALIQVPAVADAAGNAYGLILLAKLTAVAGLLTLAAANRFWLTPSLGLGRRAEGRLRGTIVAEASLAILIIALVGLWRFTPPPRAIQYLPQPSLARVNLHGDKIMAEIRFQLRPRPASATILVMGSDHAPRDAKEVTLHLSHRLAGIEPIERKAVRSADGAWRVNDLIIPSPGRWDVELGVLVTDFEKIPLEEAIDLHP